MKEVFGLPFSVFGESGAESTGGNSRTENRKAKTENMNKKSVIASSLLWAAAIIAAAVLKAPATLTLTLLPCLAVCFVLISDGTARPTCASAGK